MTNKYLDIMVTELHDQLNVLVADVLDANKTKQAAHKVELNIHQSLRNIGFNLMELFFLSCGDGDQGDELSLLDGGAVRRLEALHTRSYQSIYGEHKIKRAVYGTREGQKIECIPLDASLNLPESKYSYLLQDWDQSLIVDSPYAKVNETIGKILGFNQSIHSLERVNQKMSTSVNRFWDEKLPIPPTEKESDIFVFSVDGKGVPIRKTSNSNDSKDNKNVFDTADKNAKSGGKKVALVGATYTIDPYKRTPENIVEALFRETNMKQNLPPRPTPMYKHVRASLLRDKHDTSVSSYEEIFNWIADEEKNRNSANKKDIVCVMDGQDSLWKAIDKYLPNKKIVGILDLLHACGYVWEAAHVFHKKNSNAASFFAKTQLLRILEGDVISVITDLQYKGENEKLSDKKQESLKSICVYLTNNTHRMKYNVYLAAGYPIASGVIEGACRYVVKDRMERTGMRWILKGAHSMLSLRCILLSGYWEEFMKHRIQEECDRLYPWRPKICANDDVYSSLKRA